MDRDQTNNQQTEPTSNNPLRQRSGAFNETKQGDEKSTVNQEQEAELEQEKKEAMTERD